MKIVSVLRTSVEFGAAQAKFLHDQIKDHDSVCVTNLPYIRGVDTVPITSNAWTGWWAKMELFNPHSAIGKEDLFYMDLDTKINGDLQPLMDAVKGKRNIVMLSDFYHPEYPASGVMFIPACVKRRVWSGWMREYEKYMRRFTRRGRGGDQGVIAQLVPEIERWEDIAPGAIISYKKHVVGSGNRYYVNGISQGNGKIPKDAKIICYHGKPRPWGRK